jgi:hypothetical protein
VNTLETKIVHTLLRKLVEKGILHVQFVSQNTNAKPFLYRRDDIDYTQMFDYFYMPPKKLRYFLKGTGEDIDTLRFILKTYDGTGECWENLTAFSVEEQFYCSRKEFNIPLVKYKGQERKDDRRIRTHPFKDKFWENTPEPIRDSSDVSLGEENKGTGRFQTYIQTPRYGVPSRQPPNTESSSLLRGL